MEKSILRSIKKVLGVDPDISDFDEDILQGINSAFTDLNDIGIGPPKGFTIEDDETTWHDFFQGESKLFSDVKTFIGLKARTYFDPPTTSYRINAMEEQIKQLLWRLEVRRDKVTHPWPLEEEPWLMVV